jgi:outer membrane protein TolC
MKTATTAYYDEILKANTVKLQQQRVPRLKKAVTLAQETSRLHLGDTSSYYWAQADKEALDITITSGQSDATTALNTLKATIGLGEGTLELDENYNPEINGDTNYWTRRVEELPTFQVLKARSEASGAAAITAKDLAYPTLGLTGNIGSNLTSTFVQQQSALVILTLSVPIFDQGIRAIQTQQNESQRSIFEALMASTRESLTAQIKNLLVQWQADEKNLTLARSQLEHNRQGYNATMTLFSFGKSNFLAIRDSESSLVNAEIQLETIRTKVASEKATLELLGDYSAGRHRRSGGRVRCPIR